MLVYSKERGLKKLVPQISFAEYQKRCPSAIKIKKIPSFKTLEKWEYEGYCKTPCGCKVEPDGICPHGCQSWLIILKII